MTNKMRRALARRPRCGQSEVRSSFQKNPLSRPYSLLLGIQAKIVKKVQFISAFLWFLPYIDNT
jgi:hypothetical protein